MVCCAPMETPGTPPRDGADARERRRRERAERRAGGRRRRRRPASGAFARRRRRRAPAPDRAAAGSPRWASLVVLIVLILWVAGAFGGGTAPKPHSAAPLRVGSVATPAVLVSKHGDGIKLATFLGTASRRFYGLGPGARGTSRSSGRRASAAAGPRASSPGDANMYWSGTGWTGMPALVRDGGKLYLLIGGYDHKLHKIDAATGKIVWAYDFGDVIKSSPSVIANPHPTSADDKYLVLAGSRRGFGLAMGDPRIALVPRRLVRLGQGAVAPAGAAHPSTTPRTATAAASTSTASTTSASSPAGSTGSTRSTRSPGRPAGSTYRSRWPLTARCCWARRPTPRAIRSSTPEGANLAIEASPALLGDTIYIASGDGHVYGLRRSDLAVVFDYRVGSDMDGTTVPTRAGKLLVPIEKQYIKGHGGVLLLDPTKPAAHSPVWFFPTGNRQVAEWSGGVIGSVAVNDEYGGASKYPPLAAFNAIDGNLYVVSQDTLAPGTVRGPNLERGLRTPVTVFKSWVNGGHLDADHRRRHDRERRLRQPRPHVPHRLRAGSQGAAGALRSRDGHWWTVTITRRRPSPAAAPSSRRRCSGTGASTSAAATAGSTAWGTSRGQSLRGFVSRCPAPCSATPACDQPQSHLSLHACPNNGAASQPCSPRSRARRVLPSVARLRRPPGATSSRPLPAAGVSRCRHAGCAEHSSSMTTNIHKVYHGADTPVTPRDSRPGTSHDRRSHMFHGGIYPDTAGRGPTATWPSAAVT